MSTELTEREIEIVQRIADGEEYASVAKSMRISYEYTKFVVHRVRAKMACDTTPNLVATAIRQGIID